jgi:ribosome-binding protein aMBF1 (putative translation factor)
MIDSGQLRAARAWLGWSQGELAAKAGVGRGVVAEYERGARLPYESSMRAMQAALEAAGIVFENDQRLGRAVRYLAKSETGT